MDPPRSQKSGSISVTVEFLKDRIRHDRDAGDLRPLTDYLAVFAADESMVAQAYFAVCQESVPSPEVTLQNRSTRTSMMAATVGGPATPVAGGLSADHVGPYRLIKELGRGGQGAVHLAEDTRLGRRVALKLLTGVGALTDANLRRFHREAELASKLDHPGICAIYDYGAFEGMPYIAMRYVEGETLAKRIAALREPSIDVGDSEHIAIEDEPAPKRDKTTVKGARVNEVQTDEVLRIMEKAARAIHAAHEAGVIHRDLKPGNIMVDAAGETVVLDFGLARDLEGDGMTLTRSGDFLGTPAYMSPEQIAAGHIHLDRRSDVYSLGVTLYECLTLQRPFDAPTREALYQAILSKEPPDPRKMNRGVSSDLKVVLECALNKDRDKRYVTAEAFADDLRAVMELKPISARAISPLGRLVRWARRNPAVAVMTITAFLSLAIGLVTTWMEKQRADEQRERAEKSELDALGNLQEWARLADGRRLEDLIRRADHELWPAMPERAEAMSEWLNEARQLGGRLLEHKNALGHLRIKAKSAGASFEFDDVADQFKHDQLAALVTGLEAFTTAEPSERPTIRGVEARLAFAESVRKKTVEDYAAAWRDTIAAIARSPLYGGLAIVEQTGLIPLGPDPKSGLFEFAEIQTGEPARRGPEGDIEIGEETGMVFVLVPGGTFWMGAQSRDEDFHNFDSMARVDETPVEVTLTPFLLSKYEMTQAQWMRFTTRNPSRYDPSTGTSLGDLAIVNLAHPVENVSWDAATMVLARLGHLLPTEAQWEYACRARTETPWVCGREPACLEVFANLSDVSLRVKNVSVSPSQRFESWDDGFACHAPVGRLKANPFGFHDMTGNVMEWCRDTYDRKPERWPPAAGDGLRAPEASPRRVLRGSAFSFGAEEARSAYRAFADSPTITASVGVRPARVLLTR